MFFNNQFFTLTSSNIFKCNPYARVHHSDGFLPSLSFHISCGCCCVCILSPNLEVPLSPWSACHLYLVVAALWLSWVRLATVGIIFTVHCVTLSLYFINTSNALLLTFLESWFFYSALHIMVVKIFIMNNIKWCLFFEDNTISKRIWFGYKLYSYH